MNNLDEYEKIVIDVAFNGKKPTGIKFECIYSENSEIIHGEPAYVFNVIGNDPQTNYSFIFYVVSKDKSKMVIFKFPPEEIDLEKFYETFKSPGTSNKLV